MPWNKSKIILCVKQISFKNHPPSHCVLRNNMHAFWMSIKYLSHDRSNIFEFLWSVSTQKNGSCEEIAPWTCPGYHNVQLIDSLSTVCLMFRNRELWCFGVFRFFFVASRFIPMPIAFIAFTLSIHTAIQYKGRRSIHTYSTIAALLRFTTKFN